MLWFSKKKAAVQEIADLQIKVSKEVSRHNAVKTKVIKEATANGARFKKTVIENGFTLRIHAAVGGKR